MALVLVAGLVLLGLISESLGWLAPDMWVIAGALLATTGAFALHRSRPVLGLFCLLPGAALWGALLSPSGQASPSQAPAQGLARITFDVERTACGLTGCWAESSLVRCSPVEGAACPPLGAIVGFSGDTELAVGARVTALAKVTTRPVFLNPGPYLAWPDTRATYRAREVSGASLRVDRLHALDAGIVWVRGRIRAAFDRSLRAPHAGIARALLLGEGSAVDPEINDAIRNAGVSHVLAVSGMHVTLLAGALVALIRLLWLRLPLALYYEAGRVAAGVGVLLAPLVARVCGGSPSAWRAAWTSTLMFALSALGVRPAALQVSAFAVLSYAAIDPRDALHPGFVLSVLATAALLTGTREGVGLGGAFKESLRAWLSTIPFLAVCFGSGSLVALLANVVLLPLGGALIPLVVAHLVSVWVGIDGLLPTGWLFEVADGAFVAASRFCSALDPGLVVPPLTAVQGIALTLSAGTWLVARSWKLRVVTTLIALFVALASEWSVRHPLAAGELRLTFLDVGQGDALLIETGEGETALLDAGGSINGGPDPGAAVIIPLLRALRIRRLDRVILSHPHPDHYGGLPAVLQEFPTGELWDTGQAAAEDASGFAAKLVERARSRGTRVLRPDALCGHPQPLGSAVLEVLAPCPGFDFVRGPNDNSFVIRLRHGERSMLLTGDIEHESEAALAALRRQTLASDVLKVAHHGSRTSSTEALLSAVKPWLAVISAGRGNRFGHPHAEVVERLTASTHHVLRTDQVGGIRVTSDGRALRVDAWAPEVRLSFGASAQ